MEYEELITKFYKVLKKDGRFLLWFRNKYLPKIRYGYISFQLRGHRKNKIVDEDIINAINLYLADFEERTNG